jgi:hypothetical protein
VGQMRRDGLLAHLDVYRPRGSTYYLVRMSLNTRQPGIRLPGLHTRHGTARHDTTRATR